MCVCVLANLCGMKSLPSHVLFKGKTSCYGVSASKAKEYDDAILKVAYLWPLHLLPKALKTSNHTLCYISVADFPSFAALCVCVGESERLGDAELAHVYM